MWKRCNMRVNKLVFIFLTAFSAASASTFISERIVGGTDTTIRIWPQVVNILFTWDLTVFEQHCGGTILNDRSILTAAHCVLTLPVNRFRLRLGSAFANSGGVVRNVASSIVHPFYNARTEDYDVALVRSAVTIVFNDQTQAATIAGTNYNLDDNEIVYALGWGSESPEGPRSEVLRDLKIWTVNQNECARRYSTENVKITDNMLCAGWLSVGGRGQCDGDSGGPLFHNGVVVGVFSFSINCGSRFFPGVNVRVSRVFNWINANM